MYIYVYAHVIVMLITQISLCVWGGGGGKAAWGITPHPPLQHLHLRVQCISLPQGDLLNEVLLCEQPWTVTQ